MLWGGTFHGVANRFLRKFAPALGYKSEFSILDEDDSRSLVKACIKESGAANYGRFPSANVVKGILSFAVNSRISIDAALEQKNPAFIRAAGEFTEILRLYERKKPPTRWILMI
jgi:DNA helicase-2/ATP-dependent DNA helicase PcrA